MEYRFARDKSVCNNIRKLSDEAKKELVTTFLNDTIIKPKWKSLTHDNTNSGIILEEPIINDDIIFQICTYINLYLINNNLSMLKKELILWHNSLPSYLKKNQMVLLNPNFKRVFKVNLNDHLKNLKDCIIQQIKAENCDEKIYEVLNLDTDKNDIEIQLHNYFSNEQFIIKNINNVDKIINREKGISDNTGIRHSLQEKEIPSIIFLSEIVIKQEKILFYKICLAMYYIIIYEILMRYAFASLYNKILKNEEKKINKSRVILSLFQVHNIFVSFLDENTSRVSLYMETVRRMYVNFGSPYWYKIGAICDRIYKYVLAKCTQKGDTCKNNKVLQYFNIVQSLSFDVKDLKVFFEVYDSFDSRITKTPLKKFENESINLFHKFVSDFAVVYTFIESSQTEKKELISGVNIDKYLQKVKERVKKETSIKADNILHADAIKPDFLTQETYFTLMRYYEELSGAVRLIIKTRNWDKDVTFTLTKSIWNANEKTIPCEYALDIVKQELFINKKEKYGPFYNVIPPLRQKRVSNSGNKKAFTYLRTTNKDVADNIGIDQLAELLSKYGQNLVLFTYGYSGSGKTSTLFGSPDNSQGVVDILLSKLLENNATCELIDVSVLYGYLKTPFGSTEEIFSDNVISIDIEKDEPRSLSRSSSISSADFSDIQTALSTSPVSEGKTLQEIISSYKKVIQSLSGKGVKDDKYGQFEKKTPNNMNSSRGFTFYTWKINKKNRLCVIDMAGSEDPYDILVKTVPSFELLTKTDTDKSKYTFLNNDNILKIDKIISKSYKDFSTLIRNVIIKVKNSIKSIPMSLKGMSSFISSFSLLMYELLLFGYLFNVHIFDDNIMKQSVQHVNYVICNMAIDVAFTLLYIQIKSIQNKKFLTSTLNYIPSDDVNEKLKKYHVRYKTYYKKDQKELSIGNKSAMKCLSDVQTYYKNMIMNCFEQVTTTSWLKVVSYKLENKQKSYIDLKIEQDKTDRGILCDIQIAQNDDVFNIIKLYYSYQSYMITQKQVEKSLFDIKSRIDKVNEANVDFTNKVLTILSDEKDFVQFQNDFIELSHNFTNNDELNKVILQHYLRSSSNLFKKGKFNVPVYNDFIVFVENINADNPKLNEDYFINQRYSVTLPTGDIFKESLLYFKRLILEGFYINQVNNDLMSFFLHRKQADKGKYEPNIDPSPVKKEISNYVFGTYSSVKNLSALPSIKDGDVTYNKPCTKVIQLLNKCLGDKGVKNDETKYVMIANIRPTKGLYREGCINTLKLVQNLKTT